MFLLTANSTAPMSASGLLTHVELILAVSHEFQVFFINFVIKIININTLTSFLKESIDNQRYIKDHAPQKGSFLGGSCILF